MTRLGQYELDRVYEGDCQESMEAAEKYLSIANLMDFKLVLDVEKTATEKQDEKLGYPLTGEAE